MSIIVTSQNRGPITAVIMGLLFFQESITLRECAGIAMILSAVSVVVAGAKKKKSAAEE